MLFIYIIKCLANIKIYLPHPGININNQLP